MAMESRCQASAGDTASLEGAVKRPHGSLCMSWPHTAGHAQLLGQGAPGSCSFCTHQGRPAAPFQPYRLGSRQPLAMPRFAAALGCCLCSRTSAARTWSAVCLAAPTVYLRGCHELAVLTCSRLCFPLQLPCNLP